MLTIVNSFRKLNTSLLLQVYQESIESAGKEQYPFLSDNLQFLEAKQDFYAFWKDFFVQHNAFLAVWEINKRYVSALRIEPYHDGVLLTGLETCKEDRASGYATELLNAVISYLSDIGIKKVYSHIRNDNAASLKVHQKIGFQKISEGAVFLDGSADRKSATYLKQI